MKEKLIIIDGNAIIHRSFHAIPGKLTTKDGRMSNAAYGFASFLIKSLTEIKPQYAVLTLDKKGPTFRHEKFKEYKATRVKAPQELYDQIPMTKEISSAFDIPIFELSGYEADDLIGTISKKINEKFPNIEVIIITGDMDTLQLVNNKTKVYTMSRGLSDSVLYDEEKVKERYGISAKQLIDYKALRGDPSDNIPGVSGIGEKTASELIRNFSDLDGVYKNIGDDKIKERTKDLLRAGENMAHLSKDLSTIKLDVPIDIKIEDLKINNFDKNKINQTFSELEFKSLLPRILNIKEGQTSEDKFKRNENKFKYKLIKTEEDFKTFIKEIKKVESFAIDTETDSLKALNANLLGLSFSWKENEAYFIDLKVKHNKDDKEIKKPSLFDVQKKETNEKDKWLKELKEIIEDERKEKIGHNIKYDLQVLLNYDIEIRGKIFDTMIASYVLNPENRQHGLDSLSFSELGWEKISSKELIGDDKKIINFEDVDLEKLSNYSCEDADYTFKLSKIFKERLKKEKLEEVFNKIEIPLIKILSDMERNGISLDSQFLKNLGKKLTKDIKELEEKCFELAGERFNLKSPKQLKEILYEKMDLMQKGIKKTKTGYSTAFDELEKIKHLSPIIQLIQGHRELSKLNSTYIESLPKMVYNDNKIHTNFNQTIAATGRLSSSDPNLQNIPNKTEIGHKIRQSFISSQNWKLLSIDYSQIELRVMAHLSGDAKLTKAFKEGQDIHTFTAASINNIKLEEVSDKLRQQAKAINFGIIYGQGPHGLSQTAQISYQEARDFIDKYFKIYSGVKKYSDKIIKNAEKNLYTETLMGRKRPIPEINSSEIMKKKAAERMAINSPIQGTAADILKLAMIEIHKEIKEKEDIKMLLQVHDELIFEVRSDKVEEYCENIKKIMENIINLNVPLTVNAYSGNNWGQMDELK
ncbi:MAG: DNA polymerase I [Patescibacteria group bacterium]